MRLAEIFSPREYYAVNPSQDIVKQSFTCVTLFFRYCGFHSNTHLGAVALRMVKIIQSDIDCSHEPCQEYLELVAKAIRLQKVVTTLKIETVDDQFVVRRDEVPPAPVAEPATHPTTPESRLRAILRAYTPIPTDEDETPYSEYQVQQKIQMWLHGSEEILSDVISYLEASTNLTSVAYKYLFHAALETAPLSAWSDGGGHILRIQKGGIMQEDTVYRYLARNPDREICELIRYVKVGCHGVVQASLTPLEQQFNFWGRGVGYEPLRCKTSVMYGMQKNSLPFNTPNASWNQDGLMIGVHRKDSGCIPHLVCYSMDHCEPLWAWKLVPTRDEIEDCDPHKYKYPCILYTNRKQVAFGYEGLNVLHFVDPSSGKIAKRISYPRKLHRNVYIAENKCTYEAFFDGKKTVVIGGKIDGDQWEETFRCDTSGVQFYLLSTHLLALNVSGKTCWVIGPSGMSKEFNWTEWHAKESDLVTAEKHTENRTQGVLLCLRGLSSDDTVVSDVKRQLFIDESEFKILGYSHDNELVVCGKKFIYWIDPERFTIAEHKKNPCRYPSAKLDRTTGIVYVDGRQLHKVSKNDSADLGNLVNPDAADELYGVFDGRIYAQTTFRQTVHD